MGNTPRQGGSVVEFPTATGTLGSIPKLMPKKREKIYTQIVGVFNESWTKGLHLSLCTHLYPQADDTYKFVYFLPHKYICISVHIYVYIYVHIYMTIV